jgi:hypothetical protein
MRNFLRLLVLQTAGFHGNCDGRMHSEGRALPTGDGDILEPGRNCCGIEEAERVSVLIDADA